jgi:transglutaminase-like putative cysteine protease
LTIRSIFAGAALLMALVASRGAFAENTTTPVKGYTWLVDRHTYTVDADGLWAGIVEVERKAHDAEAARNGGRIDLSYTASFQKLEIVEAVTVKADGRRIPVAQDKIIDIAPNVSREVSLYTDLRTRSIVFPDLEAGDSIRYVYRLTLFDQTWPGYSWDFYWRSSFRTERSERILDYPASMRLGVEQHGTDQRVETKGDRTRLVFSWSNRNTVSEEAGSTSPLDWGPRVAISAFASYADIGDHYGRLHAGAAQVTPDIAALAAQIVETTVDPTAQARLIYEWVAHNIRYVAVDVGQGKLTPIVASETVKNRYGDCKAHVALMAALLAARGIESEPVLIRINLARYTLPDVPVPAFNHVILYLPQFGLYADPTAHRASFGTLPWGHYGKPVLHAVVGKSRTARIAPEKAEDHVAETYTVVKVGTDGRLSGTTREITWGAMATDLRSYATDLNTTKAAGQLRHFGSPGSGKWTKTVLDAKTVEAMLTSEFELRDEIDLPGGEALYPPAGLRFMVRPSYVLLGVHDTPRKHPFPCHAGRQLEVIEVRLPEGLVPSRLPADRNFKTSIAEYRSSYSFDTGTLRVRREFVSRPTSQVCQPELSQELVGLQSDIRRDQRSVVVFTAKN